MTNKNGLFSSVYLLKYELGRVLIQITNFVGEKKKKEKKKALTPLRRSFCSFLSSVFLTFPYTLLMHQKFSALSHLSSFRSAPLSKYRDSFSCQQHPAKQKLKV